MRRIPYDGNPVYLSAVYEQATGRINCDQWAEWQEVVSVLPHPFDLLTEWWPNRSTPPVVPQTYDVVVGDSLGNGDYASVDVSLRDAMEQVDGLSA